ncbi:MAG: aspartate aminotransferase family protein [Chloroflexota bacterium]
MEKSEIVELEQKYLLKTYNRPDFVITKGEGSWLEDSEGNRYLDAVTGIAVNSLGHGDETVMEAMKEAMSGPIHISNLYHNEPMTLLARDLCESCFADRVFFCNSGSEAVEGALKFARKYAKVVLEKEDKIGIVSFTGSFHGRSMGALSTTSTEKYRTPFAPLVPGVTFAEFNNVDVVDAVINEDTCAVIVEPVQGEGGVTPATPEFLQALRKRCDEVDALLICDEVQCGIGRTGSTWAHQGYGVEPDIMSIAKPVAGGFPMGAVMVTQKVADAMAPGDHGSTFAGGPFISTVARAVFNKITDPEFMAEVAEKSEMLEGGLRKMAQDRDSITEVRGKGMLWGVVTTVPAADLMTATQKHGLLSVVAGANVLRLIPPLTIKQEEIGQLLDRLGAAFDDVEKAHADAA